MDARSCLGGSVCRAAPSGSRRIRKRQRMSVSVLLVPFSPAFKDQLERQSPTVNPFRECACHRSVCPTS
jgi:hypothetical protein